MRDLHDSINPKQLWAPNAAITDNTAKVSNIINLQGYEACEIIIETGTETDADATFALTLEHGNDPALADTAVPAAADLIGTTALASFIFSDDNKVFKIGYIGGKQYIRATVTPSNNTGNFFMSGVALLGSPRKRPTVNPPA